VKILWVKPGKLLPLDTGGKLRTYNILRHLSAIHDVTYLSYYIGPRDHAYEQEIAKDVPGTVPVHTEGADASGMARYVDYLLHLPRAAPYSVSRFASSRVHQIVTNWITQERFDVAVCDFLASALNFPLYLAIPTVLFQHNVETLLWQRRSQFAEKWLDRWTAKIESFKMARFEPSQIKRFHQVFAVSLQDSIVMAGMIDPARISVIPTGVDLSTYHYDPELRVKSPLVVFTGSMDWTPNVDGVTYFCRDIWPRVLSQIPSARFRIVGRNPNPRVRDLARDSVEVTGTVPDIVGHLREAAVVVVPLRMGGGTRLKIYEAMAMGKAIVSTQVGAEGLDVRHDHDIALADEPGDFADYVVTLLCDEITRCRYESAAAATAQRHDWSQVTQIFADALRKAIADVNTQTVSEYVAARP
jgi:polysaccharide biosynthesis protein PslH